MLCYVMYGSWDTDLDGQNVLPFWTIFCHFTSLTTEKIKFLKNWKKKNRTYYHFTHVYHNVMYIWFLKYEAWQTKWKTTWKIKILKNEKMPGDIILHMCIKIYDPMMYGSREIVRDRQTNQKDRQMEKVTYRRGCPT